MDIEKTLAAEHSKRQCLKIVRYVGQDPERFSALVETFVKGPYTITQRAAWPLSVCVEAHPALATPHLAMLLKSAARSGVHNAVRRNVMRLMQFAVLPRRFHGRVMELAFRFLNDPKEAIAVKCFSITVIQNIIRQYPYPELEHELTLAIEHAMPYATAGFKVRANRALIEIEARRKSISE